MYQTEIHIKGKMNPNWSDWFEELQVKNGSADETILSGSLPDMSAVYGVISRLSNLVIPLISVTCSEDIRDGEAKNNTRKNLPLLKYK